MLVFMLTGELRPSPTSYLYLLLVLPLLLPLQSFSRRAEKKVSPLKLAEQRVTIRDEQQPVAVRFASSSLLVGQQ